MGDELSDVSSDVVAESGVVNHHPVNISDTVSVSGCVVGVMGGRPLLSSCNMDC